MRNVDITNKGKLIALIAVVLGAFAVIIVAVIADADASLVTSMVGLLGTTLGYLVGNGSGAAKGFVSVPPFQPAPNRQLEILTKIVEEDPELKADPAVIARAKTILQKHQDDNG